MSKFAHVASVASTVLSMALIVILGAITFGIGVGVVGEGLSFDHYTNFDRIYPNLDTIVASTALTVTGLVACAYVALSIFDALRRAAETASLDA